MNKRLARIVTISFVAALALFGALASLPIMTKPVSAVGPSSDDTILKKTLLNGLRTCYSGTSSDPNIYMKGEILPSDFSGLTSLVATGWGKKGDTDGTIRVPNHVGNTLSDADISCKELLVGYRSGQQWIKGLAELYGISTSAPSNIDQKISVLRELGYEVGQVAEGDDTGCVSFSYQTAVDSQYSDPVSTNQVCFKLENGKVNVGYSGENVNYPEQQFTSPLYLFYDAVNYQLRLMDSTSTTGYPLREISITPYNPVPWGNIVSELNSFAGQYDYPGDAYGYGEYHYRIAAPTIPEDVGGENFTNATRVNYDGLSALRYFVDNQSVTFSNYTFDTFDIFLLYKSYLNLELQNNNNLILGSGDDCNVSKEALINAENPYVVRNGSMWCRLYGVDTGSHYNVVNSSYNGLVDAPFSNVVNMLMQLNYDELEAGGVQVGELEGGAMTGDDAVTTDPPADPGNSNAPSCFTDGDALGWILCPALKITGSAASAAYQYIVENWLKIDASWLSASSENGAYDGWTQIRDFANIFFVIVFLIVIISQVTGIGITNYGVKKILPKLIIVVVLVNISFLLCQIAVDISNIVGSGMYNLLRSLNTGTGETLTEFGLDNIVSGLLGTLGTGIIGAGAAAGIAIVALTDPGAVLVPALIAIVGALIALLFFFIVLAVRNAGVVILTVLAPVAIVCYALPNTKSIFDRWRKIFMALLILYPICGIMMGGGYFVSNLMLKTGDNGFVESLVAMLLQIVPIFMIPSILRNSLALAGNIGARISTFGARWGTRATGAMRNSDLANRTATSLNNWGANRGQQILGNINRRLRSAPGIGGAVRNFEDNSRVGKMLASGQSRRVARNKMAYRKMQLDEGADAYLASTMTQQSIKDDLAAQQYKQEQEQIDRTADSIITGSMSFNNGTTEEVINANDVETGGSLDRALQYYLDQYDTTQDEGMMTRARAVAKVMIDKGGDKGRTRVVRQLKNHTFVDGAGNTQATSSFRGLSKYIARNDKWMAGLKTEDNGAFNMISDGANYSGTATSPTNAKALKSMLKYDTMGAGSISASAVPSLSEDFLDSYNAAVIDSSTGRLTARYDVNDAANFDQAAAEDLIKLSETFERAMADPTVAQKVKDKDLAEMEKLHKAADEIKRARSGLTNAAYDAQYGKYQKLTPGRSVKIQHAQMPAGWHRIQAGEIRQNPQTGQYYVRLNGVNVTVPAGAKVGSWMGGGGLLSAEDAARAEAIVRHNADADVQNNL